MTRAAAPPPPAAKPTGAAAFLKRAQKDFGVQVAAQLETRRFVTRSPAFNRMCGLGGLPLSGRYLVVLGPWSGGKSTLMARILSDVARGGGVGYYADVERARTASWFEAVGLSAGDYVYAKHRSQEEHQDKILDFLIAAAKAKKAGDLEEDAPVLVVVDTVTEFAPAGKLDGSVGSKDYGLSANLLNDWMKPILVLGEEANACLALVSQERRKEAPFNGAPDWMCVRPTTGDAVEYGASVEVRVEKGATLKEGETKCGNEHRIRVLKSKFGMTSSTAGTGSFYVSNGQGEAPQGVDLVRELIAEGLAVGVLRKGAAGTGEEEPADEPAARPGRGRDKIKRHGGGGAEDAPKKSGSGRIEAAWDSGLSWGGEALLRKRLRADDPLSAELEERINAAVDAEAASRGHRF